MNSLTIQQMLPMLPWQLASTEKLANPDVSITLNAEYLKVFPVKTRNLKKSRLIRKRCYHYLLIAFKGYINLVRSHSSWSR